MPSQRKKSYLNFLFGTVLIVLGFGYFLLQGESPQTSGNLQATNLGANVRVVKNPGTAFSTALLVLGITLIARGFYLRQSRQSSDTHHLVLDFSGENMRTDLTSYNKKLKSIDKNS